MSRSARVRTWPSEQLRARVRTWPCEQLCVRVRTWPMPSQRRQAGLLRMAVWQVPVVRIFFVPSGW